MKKNKALVPRTAIVPFDKDDLLKQVAMDIGKEVADYIERQYPEAVTATSSTFLLSVRNMIHNQIVSAVRDKKWVGDWEDGTLRPAASPEEWLEWRRFTRRRIRAIWRKARQTKEERE